MKTLEITKDVLLKQNHGQFKDLNWWVNNINVCFQPMTSTDLQFILYTDSSNPGWGAVVQDILLEQYSCIRISI